jgi:hypothetical protein
MKPYTDDDKKLLKTMGVRTEPALDEVQTSRDTLTLLLLQSLLSNEAIPVITTCERTPDTSKEECK